MAIILAAVAWLLTYLVHSTLFLLGACALAALGLVRSSPARDTLWKVALLGGFLTATTQTALRVQPRIGHMALAAQHDAPLLDVARVRTVRPEPAESTPAGVAFASAIAQREIMRLPEPPAVRTVTPVLSGVKVTWPELLVALWVAGAMALLARLLWARLVLFRRLRLRRVIGEGPLFEALVELCGRAGVLVPRLSASDRLKGPIAFGREICVPERALEQLTPGEQRAVLAHELGHIVRRDPAWLAIATWLESVGFLQPLNRVARRRLREISEYLCDDWAAERADGLVLARCLARVAEWVQAEPEAAAVAGMAGRCSELVSRVERLVEGAAPARPARLLIRVSAVALALAGVAWSVPGVAAEDVDDAWVALPQAIPGAQLIPVAQGQAWGELQDGGRIIQFLPGFSARFTGQGRLGFRQFGRAIALSEGYVLTAQGRRVNRSTDLCESMGPFRIEGPGGSWEVQPMRIAGTQNWADAGTRSSEFATASAREALRASAEALADARLAQEEARAEADAATDAALNGEVDEAIDTLVQLWVKDPEAVRRAAQRIARNYDRDLRPQFESLGVQLGRELSPQLQRLTDRVGRDLRPEFERMGAALGEAIIQSLGQVPDTGPNSTKRLKLPAKH